MKIKESQDLERPGEEPQRNKGQAWGFMHHINVTDQVVWQRRISGQLPPGDHG